MVTASNVISAVSMVSRNYVSRDTSEIAYEFQASERASERDAYFFDRRNNSMKIPCQHEGNLMGELWCM